MTVENRYRVLGQVLNEIRAAVGADFPVLVKRNSQDFLERIIEQGTADSISMSRPFIREPALIRLTGKPARPVPAKPIHFPHQVI